VLMEATIKNDCLIWCLGNLTVDKYKGRIEGKGFIIKSHNLKTNELIEVESDKTKKIRFPYVSVRKDGQTVFIGGYCDIKK
jgi:hypothetical protein